ncbi:helix-turn-helix DNA-binding protein [Gordonia phage SCentae]|nr:helix-turn-helix DNA-binding protein [Gordonia phage SCentae]
MSREFAKPERGEGVHAKSPDLDRYLYLEDLKWRASLVQLRIAAGLSKEDVAKAWGTNAHQVEVIEDITSDPRLSTLRRYMASIGALSHHAVQMLPNPLELPEDLAQAPEEGDWP